MDRDQILRVFYAGEDFHIKEIRQEVTGFFQADISTMVINNPPAFPMEQAPARICALVAEGVPRVFYLGADLHIKELRLERTGWAQADISAIVTNNPPAPPTVGGSRLCALVAGGVLRVLYYA